MVIPSFEELMARCIQEQTRVEEHEIPLPKGPPVTFSSHAKKRNNSNRKERLDLRVEGCISSAAHHQ